VYILGNVIVSQTFGKFFFAKRGNKCLRKTFTKVISVTLTNLVFCEMMIIKIIAFFSREIIQVWSLLSRNRSETIIFITLGTGNYPEPPWCHGQKNLSFGARRVHFLFVCEIP
jgi:hypothetical protein